MFNEVKIRRWHRVVGVIIAPLLFAQAISGLVIAFEVLLGIHSDVAKLIGKETPLCVNESETPTPLQISLGRMLELSSEYI